ncbi:MAG: high-affinity branched-chain amino acid ABC transporter permease LivM [Rhodospirillaceae bacterium]
MAAVPPPLDLKAALREAAFTGGVALLLTVPLVGLRTLETSAGLVIRPQFAEVGIAVLLVFLGRLGLVLVAAGRGALVLPAALALALAGWLLPFPAGALRGIALAGGVLVALRAGLALGSHHSRLSEAERDRRMDRVGARLQDASRLIGPAAVLFALALPMLPFADRGVVDLGCLLLSYIMLGWGLNIVVGLAGLLDLGYVAFYAVGAYSYALLAQNFGIGFWLGLPLAGAFASLYGLLLGFPVLRLRGDYFAIVTLACAEIVRVVLLNWTSLTNGPVGVAAIPRPSFFGFADFTAAPAGGRLAFHQLFGLEFAPVHRIIFLYYVILALALVVNLFTLRIRRLPLGRAWEALREDDIACSALGINRTNIKLAAFAIAGMFGGFAGAFFATRQGFISPESFTFIESAIILAVVVLGGMGSQAGVVIAALLVVGLPEAFRELAQYRMLAFGVGMVLIMLWRPRGLLAHRDPTILLHVRKSARQQQAEAEARE